MDSNTNNEDRREYDGVSHFSLPTFDMSDPRLWFAQIEALFEASRIRTQRTRYNRVVGMLPPAVAKEVADLIYEQPNTDPYDTIKTAIISQIGSTDEQNLRKLLSGVELGDRTLS